MDATGMDITGSACAVVVGASKRAALPAGRPTSVQGRGGGHQRHRDRPGERRRLNDVLNAFRATAAGDWYIAAGQAGTGDRPRRALMQRKAREWFGRYLPMEITGTLAAVMVALAVSGLGGSWLQAAVAAGIAETVGYYGVAALREARRYDALKGQRRGVRRAWFVMLRTTRDLTTEFGAAELLDSTLLRPALMIFMTGVTTDLAMGVFGGKLLADAAFYALAIAGYEGKQRLCIEAIGMETANT
jgi:hypothetical protein